WRIVGEYSNFSIFDVESNDELHDLLSGLPLSGGGLGWPRTPPSRRAGQPRSRARLMTTRWIWLVPS
ncbi:muconolactone Delta-isomerase family protein, partial [Nocardia farcinica]|uniref:muconolactone Delta-isomerase family protein n=1 Tax=Nocardia farcinica TaxID=37329 RepID=UPI0024541436